jgi:hypothetical protein
MIRPLERHSYRAPLALECVDGVTGAVISDGLTATVWRRDDPDTQVTARRSPLSGLLGVKSLPGMWRQTHALGGSTDIVAGPPPPGVLSSSTPAAVTSRRRSPSTCP